MISTLSDEEGWAMMAPPKQREMSGHGFCVTRGMARWVALLCVSLG